MADIPPPHCPICNDTDCNCPQPESCKTEFNNAATERGSVDDMNWPEPLSSSPFRGSCLDKEISMPSVHVMGLLPRNKVNSPSCNGL